MYSSHGCHHRHRWGCCALQLKAQPSTFQKSWPRAQMLPLLAVFPRTWSSSLSIPSSPECSELRRRRPFSPRKRKASRRLALTGPTVARTVRRYDMARDDTSWEAASASLEVYLGWIARVASTAIWAGGATQPGLAGAWAGGMPSQSRLFSRFRAAMSSRFACLVWMSQQQRDVIGYAHSIAPRGECGSAP